MKERWRPVWTSLHLPRQVAAVHQFGDRERDGSGRATGELGDLPVARPALGFVAPGPAAQRPEDRLRPGGEFVVGDRADFDWSVDVVRRHRLAGRVALLTSAVHGAVRPADLAAWILESGLPLRYQAQLHKLIWGAETRGV